MKAQRLTILSIFGTRPEVIKMFPVLEEIRKNPMFKNIVVSTSQHREMIEDLFTLLSITPDYNLNIIQENQSLMDIAIRALSGLDPILRKHRLDLVLVQGDTTTAFIGALAAFYHKIPVGHIEAGLRSFDKMQPYPEETNRRLTSLVCDLHFAPTMQNAEHLKKEGVDPDKIFVTGNTVIDCLMCIASRNRQALKKYVTPEVLIAGRLILVTAHRRENWGKPIENLCHALVEIAQSYSDVQIVYPVHLNPNVRKTVLPILDKQERIFLLDPLPYEPFVELMTRSYFIITDSGGIQEEGLSLRKPILVFRKVTERPEGLATGGAKIVGLELENLVQEASHLLDDSKAYRKMITDHNPYGDGNAAKRIVQAILYYFKQGERPADFRYEESINTENAKGG